MARVTHRDDAEAVLYIRVPGWLKNDLAGLADQQGLSINAWCANQLRLALREQRGLPAPPVPAGPVAGPVEAVRAWLEGETLLTPCGRTGSCAGTDGEVELVSGVGWCRECGIRLA